MRLPPENTPENPTVPIMAARTRKPFFSWRARQIGIPTFADAKLQLLPRDTQNLSQTQHGRDTFIIR